MPYISCQDAWCDYPDWCQADHWIPGSEEEARGYLRAIADAVSSADQIASLVWEASGILEVGVDKVYVPARFLPGVPLKERSVPVSRDVAASLRRSLYDK